MTFEAILLTVLTTGLGLLAAWYFVSKRLSFEVLDPVELLTAVEDHLRSQLRVLVGDREVEKPVALPIYIRNFGYQGIRPEDVEDPIAVAVGSKEVVTAYVQGSSLVEVDAEYETPSGETVVPIKLLKSLNRKDGFSLVLITDGMPSTIEITARVSGQTSKRPINIRRVIDSLGRALVGVGVLFGLYVTSSFVRENYFVEDNGLLSTALGAVALLASLVALTYLLARMITKDERTFKRHGIDII